MYVYLVALYDPGSLVLSSDYNSNTFICKTGMLVSFTLCCQSILLVNFLNVN